MFLITLFPGSELEFTSSTNFSYHFIDNNYKINIITTHLFIIIFSLFSFYFNNIFTLFISKILILLLYIFSLYIYLTQFIFFYFKH